MRGGASAKWLLLLLPAVLTLLVGLAAIRWLAPGLLGVQVAVDRQVVQLAETAPSFYDGAFDQGTPQPGGDMILDPLSGHRHRAIVPENYDLMSPFDLLGFRNRAIPVVADIVTIGDSQTMGMGSSLDDNWPSQLAAQAVAKQPVVYNMSAGGWGAVQYLHLFPKALLLQPRVVVVAFYTGNDPADSLHLAYQFEPWASLRTQPEAPEMPPSAWPPTPEQKWNVRFTDGTLQVFTPAARLSVNDRDYAGVAEGYAIMAESARRMQALVSETGVGLVFTIIPTKELVFAGRVKQDGLTPPDAYNRLIEHERQNIDELASILRKLPQTTYVDVVTPLQRVALKETALYPSDDNGHPRYLGNRIIAEALGNAVDRHLRRPPKPGLAVLTGSADGRDTIALIRDGWVMKFWSPQILRDNGWTLRLNELPHFTPRDLARLSNRGAIATVDRQRYGPRSVAP